jgi:CheY-like chemotaxis protein
MGRILIIDDNEADRLILKERLGEVHKIYEAGSYREGIRLIDGNNYDVIIWDYMFSREAETGLDGIEYAKKHSPSSKNILLSGTYPYSNDKDINIADLFAQKDGSYKEVIESINNLTKKSANSIEDRISKLERRFKMLEVDIYGRHNDPNDQGYLGRTVSEMKQVKEEFKSLKSTIFWAMGSAVGVISLVVTLAIALS